MYKNKDCIGRSSKYHAAWTKNELLEECEKLGLHCPKSMTKAQICGMLNENKKSPSKKKTTRKVLEHRYGPLISKKSICTLPRDVKFKIFDELPIGELARLCQTDKDCAKTCNNDEFWRRRLIAQYNMFEKTEDVSWKAWYQKVFNSGDLKVIKTADHSIVDLRAERVVKCFPIAKAIFYINLDSELWAMGDFTSIPGGRGGYHYMRNRVIKPTFDKNQPMLKDVKDVFIGVFTLILKNDGQVVWDAGLDYEDLLRNIEVLYYNPMTKEHCLAKDLAGNLYLVQIEADQLVTKNVASNIKTAALSNTGKIFAISKDGALLSIYASREVSTVSQPGYYNLNPPHYVSDILIRKQVKRITATDDYLFVIDTNDKLWIYKEDRFYPFDASNLNLQGIDILAGFNQNQYQIFNVRSVKPGNTLSIIDTNYNLYLQKINEIHVPLQVFETNVVTGMYGSDYIAYVKTRGK